jgi:hypothetical protein
MPAADPPAWLLPDGRVVLEPHGAAQAVLAVEAALRSDRRNGRPPGPDLAGLAAVLAEALPPLAAVLPEVRWCWSAKRAEAGLAPVAGPGRFWLPVREVAARTGATERGVRSACAAGRVRACQTPAGRWLVDPASAEEWRARRGRRAAVC